jgi:hypothetical protein
MDGAPVPDGIARERRVVRRVALDFFAVVHGPDLPHTGIRRGGQEQKG